MWIIHRPTVNECSSKNNISYMSITPLSNFDDLHTTGLINKIVVKLVQWKGVCWLVLANLKMINHGSMSTKCRNKLCFVKLSIINPFFRNTTNQNLYSVIKPIIFLMNLMNCPLNRWTKRIIHFIASQCIFIGVSRISRISW